MNTNQVKVLNSITEALSLQVEHNTEVALSLHSANELLLAMADRLGIYSERIAHLEYLLGVSPGDSAGVSHREVSK